MYFSILSATPWQVPLIKPFFRFEVLIEAQTQTGIN